MAAFRDPNRFKSPACVPGPARDCSGSGPAGLPGPLEGKVAREVEDLAAAAGGPWTSTCERLEAQALTAARIIDIVMEDGRLHLTAPQHRIIREALAELREVLDPPPSVLGPVQSEVEQFVASLTMMPASAAQQAASEVSAESD